MILRSPKYKKLGKKKRNEDDDDEETLDNEETLIQLRSKKVKFSHIEESALRKEVERIVSGMKISGTTERLMSKGGGISITPVSRELPPRFRSVPIRLLREIIKELL